MGLIARERLAQVLGKVLDLRRAQESYCTVENKYSVLPRIGKDFAGRTQGPGTATQELGVELVGGNLVLCASRIGPGSEVGPIVLVAL